MSVNILVCDDERDIVKAVSIYLRAEGYNIFPAYNGKEALKILEEERIELVLLDIMMPEMDGLDTLSKLREENNIPVILLTAKSEDTDKVLGLNVGADDYITKPFNPVELVARVKSQLRRYMQLGGKTGVVSQDDVLKAGGLMIDDRSKIVTLDGEELKLTKTEYDILKFMMENRGQVFSPRQIYEKVWNDISIGNEGTVAVHIRHLREKIELNPSDPRYIKVVWGRGYKFENMTK